MRKSRWIAGLLMALLLPACGGSSTPTTPATPTPCTQSPLLQVDGAAPPRSLVRAAFSTAAGRLDITVDWTFDTSPISVYLVSAGSCPVAQFNAQTCTFLLRSETTTKPRKVSTTVSAGNYELLVANFSTVDESISGQVVLSSSTCPAFASARSEASAAGSAGRSPR